MSETLPASDAPPDGAALVAALGRRSIVLVGMMGAGKSSIGRRVATRLAIPFVDADAEIELAADMTIAEIFAVHGEPYFRAGEARVIARLLERGNGAVAVVELVADGAQREPGRGKTRRQLDGLHQNIGGAGQIALGGMIERPFIAPVGDQVAGRDEERAGIGHRRCSRGAAK